MSEKLENIIGQHLIDEMIKVANYPGYSISVAGWERLYDLGLVDITTPDDDTEATVDILTERGAALVTDYRQRQEGTAKHFDSDDDGTITLNVTEYVIVGNLNLPDTYSEGVIIREHKIAVAHHLVGSVYTQLLCVSNIAPPQMPNVRSYIKRRMFAVE